MASPGREAAVASAERARWLRLGRWLVAALALTMLALSLVGTALFPGYAAANPDADTFTPNFAWTPAQVRAGLAELGWPAATVAWLALGRDLTSLAVSGALVLLLLRRRADSWFGLFVALVFVLLMAAPGPFLAVAERWQAVERLGGILDAVGWQLFFMLFFLFPDGRAVPRWTRWLVGVWSGFVLFQALGYDISASLPESPVVAPIYFGLVIAAIGSQVYRYLRHSNAVQRQQTKWVVFTLASGLAVILLGDTLGFTAPRPGRLGPDLVIALLLWMLFGLTFILVPAAIGVAILRYRLWDIDVIIRRTLAYAVVTGVLGALYLGGVVALQALFVRLTGQASTL
ncbi:MAG TPA: hypothetical protein PKD53_19230, partial [Chloroflexaceae bacterium]|nr:hypothetical protein [Chloroflexaceae bacterium]